MNGRKVEMCFSRKKITKVQSPITPWPLISPNKTRNQVQFSISIVLMRTLSLRNLLSASTIAPLLRRSIPLMPKSTGEQPKLWNNLKNVTQASMFLSKQLIRDASILRIPQMHSQNSTYNQKKISLNMLSTMKMTPQETCLRFTCNGLKIMEVI